MLTLGPCRLFLVTVVGAVLAAAAIPAAASAAAQRYASPNGLGDCSSASPCSIQQAVGSAGPGDEVIVNPGDYPLIAALQDHAQITIHGVLGKPRPRILFNGQGDTGVQLEFGSTLRYVEVDRAAGGSGQSALRAFPGGNVDQVIARAPAVAMDIGNSTIRNSVAVASGTNGRALRSGASSGYNNTSSYRNVTAIATGSGGVPIEATASTTGSATIHLVNVIAYAGPGALSLVARTDNSGAQAKITAAHTNYQSADSVGSAASFVDGGGNRAEEPAFVNPAGGDYRQAAGGYTIDAGLNDPINGAFDVDGDPRAIGTTDIGADEFVPATTPSPTTPSPTTPPPTTPSSARPFAGVRLVSTRLSFARGFITATLRCPVGTVGRCSGKTELTARRRPTSSRAGSTVTLGRATFSIAVGKQGTVRVRVFRAGRRLLSGVRRVKGKDTNAARDGAGQSQTTVAAVTIRRRHR